ncbi:MAG: glycosyltransferase family 4 protein [Lachnospiraceae bacterium]|nr:glycosyltransferase family 4 protein [Lachnospiraceae bacterium]
MRLLVISLCTQGVGVMKEHFIYYCRRFAKLADLYCVTNDNVDNSELCAIETLNVSFSRKKPLGYLSPKKYFSIKKFIKRVDPDVIFILSHHASNVILADILKPYKVVYQVHDPEPHIGTSFIEKMILQIQLKKLAKYCKKIIASAEDVKQKTLKVVKYNPNDIEVIPLAVLDNYIDDSIKPSDDDIDLLFYGKIKKYKGLDTFIEALTLLEKEDIKPKVKIVGGLNVLQVFPNIKYIPDNVSIEGFAENKLLISYIKKAKALVLPYHEATGTMAIGQAFYYGTPVIATDVGCFKEYIGDGGLICKHSDAISLANVIKDYLSDYDLQKKLSDNAKKNYVNKFNIYDITCKHIELFNKVCEGN